jgi:hypothetical protein
MIWQVKHNLRDEMAGYQPNPNAAPSSEEEKVSYKDVARELLKDS